MAEKLVRDILIRVTYEPGTAAIESNLQANGVGTGIMWEALKCHVINMTKVAAWSQDPEEREILVHAAHGLKMLMLGTDQAVVQLRERRKMQEKELGGQP